MSAITHAAVVRRSWRVLTLLLSAENARLRADNARLVEEIRRLSGSAGYLRAENKALVRRARAHADVCDLAQEIEEEAAAKRRADV